MFNFVPPINIQIHKDSVGNLRRQEWEVVAFPQTQRLFFYLSFDHQILIITLIIPRDQLLSSFWSQVETLFSTRDPTCRSYRVYRPV